MKESKKYSTAKWVAFIFCALGCTLFFVQAFVKSEYDLFTVAIALNGIGLFAFLFGRKSEKVSGKNE